MTKETLTVDQVQENINEFILFWNEERDEEVDAVAVGTITHEMIKEMNADITASQESNVPEIMFEILVDEDIVPDEDEMKARFVEWYMEKHS
jgi:hypothetical protein